jgi:putative glutamine amidotransferase
VKIGLTRTENLEKHQYYIDWLKVNENIQIITLSADDKNLNEINNCDALVLSGGIDIHPKFYGGETIYTGAPENFNEKRDEFEIAAFHSAQENQIPILGICRGMQLINVIHKGTLIQNLDDENLNKLHSGNPDKHHPANIDEETLLHGLTCTTKAEINSAHHQAIDKPGEGLLVNCKADDGTIEGFEWKNKAGRPFLLAVQWHPERMFRFGLQDSAMSKEIRDQFISAIKKSIALKNEDH